MFSLSSWLRSAVAFGVVAGASLIQTQLSQAEEPATPTQPALLGPVETKSVEPEQPKSAWLTHPPYRKTPRAAYFTFPPTGCGYYSVLNVINGETRPAAPKFGYPPFALMSTPFYDVDFRYVDDPKYNPDFLERLHRVHLGDNWLFGTGGQAWWRHMHEFSSRLSGRTNDYDLLRARVYGDLWYKDRFRIFAELVTANTANQDLPPLRIDEDRGDFQNLFFDAKIGEIDCQPVYVRVGRQELLYGSQRLISPPDWANTRRTFQGVRTFWSNDKFDVDMFWAQPVIPNNTGWSPTDHNQHFYGAWVTYRPEKQQAIDMYYLFLDNTNNTTTAGLQFAPTSVHTLGTRYSGDSDGFLWDVEGMLQLGARGGQPIHSASVAAGIGYHAKCLPMNPTVWAYYDWASGDNSPNAGNYDTFNQLFPFGHYYMGWLDLVGRQNIRDANAHLYLYPAKWATVNLQYHCFQLDRSRDALYNAFGTPTRVSLNGSAGGDVGQELDVIVNFHLSKRSDFMVGWSKLYAGDFIRNTGNGTSPELFHMMYNIRW